MLIDRYGTVNTVLSKDNDLVCILKDNKIVKQNGGGVIVEVALNV